MPAQPAAQGAEQDQQPSMWNMAKKMLLVWVGTQLVLGQNGLVSKFMNRNAPVTPPPSARPVSQADPAAVQRGPLQSVNFWPEGIDLTLHIQLSTAADPADVWARKDEENLPGLTWEGLKYGDWGIQREVDWEVVVPESVKHNGSLWADFYLANSKHVPIDHRNPAYDPSTVVHTRKLLTRYWPKRQERKVKNLLSGDENYTDTEEEEEEQGEAPIVPYWHHNLTLGLVSDFQPIPYGQLQAPGSQHVILEPSNKRVADAKVDTAYHYPVLFPNDFWLLRDQMTEINETVSTLPLHLSLHSMSFFKFNIYSSMGASFEQQARQAGGTGGELDELKRMLIETNPWLLAVTAIVTLLHTVFEFLAFKNDVSHWRKADHDMVGVSFRTIVSNVVVQVIILLYLLDNNENTSWTILVGQGMGLLVEMWKITKVVDIKLLPAAPGSILPYKVHIEDKKKDLSVDELKTQEYDKLAFKYVSWVMIPVLLAYTVYSLVYETHRGWYSFIISTLTSFVYAFGFVQLVPQLIINYKLKSVAHMPARAMVYKLLSTVVDDFFSFIIKMPLLHRLSCFRDDVVFLVYLYQRYIYRVDPMRANEYGQLTEEKIKELEKREKAQKEGRVAETKKTK